MGTTTDGQLCYGVIISDDPPWADEKYDHDIDDWWIGVSDYVNPVEYPFTEDGEYKDGFIPGDPRIDEWCKNRYEWHKSNPLPVELVNYCSCDYAEYILAVRGTVSTASRGYPVEVNSLLVDADATEMLKSFCAKYFVETADEPKWYLSSYWG